MISQLKNFDIFVNKFFNILCLFMVFTLNLSAILTRIFPQTELEASLSLVKKWIKKPLIDDAQSLKLATDHESILSFHGS